MKITDNCVALFREVVAKHNAKAIRIFTQETKCGHGKSVALEVTNDDSLRMITVNGLDIAISEEDEPLFDNIIFDAKDGKVLIQEECDHCNCCHEECDGECDCDHEDGCCHKEGK